MLVLINYLQQFPIYFETCFVFLGSIIFSPGLYRKYGYIFLSSIIFLVVYVLFSCWWEPDYREFWVATMFAFWILFFLFMNFLLDSTKSLKPLPSVLIYLYIFLLGGLLFYFNFTGFIYPNAGSEFRKFDIISKTESSYY